MTRIIIFNRNIFFQLFFLLSSLFFHISFLFISSICRTWTKRVIQISEHENTINPDINFHSSNVIIIFYIVMTNKKKHKNVVKLSIIHHSIHSIMLSLEDCHAVFAINNVIVIFFVSRCWKINRFVSGSLCEVLTIFCI